MTKLKYTNRIIKNMEISTTYIFFPGRNFNVKEETDIRKMSGCTPGCPDCPLCTWIYNSCYILKFLCELNGQEDIALMLYATVHSFISDS